MEVKKNNRIKSALESMMFIWGEPLDVKSAAEALFEEEDRVKEAFLDLKKEYEDRRGGLIIRRVGKSFQIVTNSENGDYVKRLCTPVKVKKLSQSALEVLAIIAYRQPVTRGEIESIRGIKCERVVEGLKNRGLVTEVGRGNGIGRPVLFGTTRKFLEYMNIEDLSQLPIIQEEFDKEDEVEDELYQMKIDI